MKILAALGSSGRLSRKELSNLTGIHQTMISFHAGYNDAKINERPCHKHNLRNLGLVTMDLSTTPTEYSITADGRNALAKLRR